MRRVNGVFVGSAGALVLLAGAALYADTLGLTDHFSVRDGALVLSLALPGPSELSWVTPVPVAGEGLHDNARTWAPPIALALMVVALMGARRVLTRLRAAWPRGVQGATGLAFTVAVFMAFLPAGRGLLLGASVAVMTLGFVLLTAGLGGGVLEALGASWEPVLEPDRGPPPAVVAAVAGLFVAGSAMATSVWLFDRTPHVVDGISHLFQARTLGTGRFFLDSHPLREFFDLNTMVNDGRWYSQYPPGHTLLLLVGLVAGVPWIVNPLLGGAFVVSLFLLGRELYGDAVARTAVVLAVLSPFVLLMSSEFYSHASAVVWLTLALLAYVRFTRTGSRRAAVAGGLVLGLAVLTRPLTALAFAIPVLFDAALHREVVAGWRRASAAVLGGTIVAAFAVLLLGYNVATTGDPLLFAYALAKGPGFGNEPATPLLTIGRLQLLNDALFALPFPSLALVVPAFLGRRPGRWEYLLAAVPVSLLFAHAPIGYRDVEFGPRYLYEALPALLLLGAIGIGRCGNVIERFAAGLDTERLATRARGAIVLAFMVAIGLSWPLRLHYYGSPMWEWAVRDGVDRAVIEAGLSDALVFVSTSPEHGDRPFEAVFLRNAIDPVGGQVVFALDLGERNAELMDFYGDRRAWLYGGDGLVELSR